MAETIPMLTMFALAAAMASAQASVPPPPPWSPVLECDRRVYAIDGLVCEDASLLAGSRIMEAAYARALATLPAEQGARLAETQQAWSKQRNMCAFKRKAKACVARLQVQRTRAIEGR